MKKFLGKKIRLIVESALLIIGVLMFVILMGEKKELPIISSLVNEYSIWQLGFDSVSNFPGQFTLIVLFFILALVTIVSIVLSFVKKRSYYIIGIIYNIVSTISFFIVNNYFGEVLGGGGITCLIFNIIFMVLAVGYHVACLILNRDSFDEREVKGIEEDEAPNKVNKFIALVSAILSLTVIMVTLFIPLYTVVKPTGEMAYIPINALHATKENADIILFALFAVLFLINVLNVTYFLSSLGYIKKYEKMFLKKCSDVVYIDFAISIGYFVVGLSVSFFNNLEGYTVVSYSYVPFIIMSIIMVIFSVISVRWTKITKEKIKRSFPSIEMLIYSIVFALIPLIALYLKLLVVKADGVEQINIKAITILKDYSTLEGSYQLMAFFLILMGIACGALLVLTITSFFKNKNLFYKLSMVSILLDMIYIFAIGTFGLYYQIVQTMNEETLQKLFAHYGFTYTSPEYTIESETIFAFLGALGLLIIVLIRNPLKDIPAGEYTINGIASSGGSNQGRGEALSSSQEENLEEGVTFDACPAFTELDSKINDFNAQLEERKAKEFVEPSLPNVCKFIVDYAKESRLHLSYSVEDIATFVAGLGACRLSILQGMSGTGKTSLPKIFLEAIMGNCEIVEVESSWRDKNELIGYYNEFSKTFTPKKFTQALYKAKLNEEVPTFIVLDEMNLSRIEYYFSDFLSLMENEEGKREIKLLNVKLFNTINGEQKSYVGLSEDHTIKIPSNIWFIGTANRDESTFEISDKVYDRAHTMNFNKRAPKAIFHGTPLDQRYLPYAQLINLMNAAKETYAFDIDKNNVIKEVERILSPYNISFGNRISKQIEEFVKVYCSCFDDPQSHEFEAVETIILSKVVHKLENKSVENKEVLIAEFNKLKLKKCSEFVSKLNED